MIDDKNTFSSQILKVLPAPLSYRHSLDPFLKGHVNKRVHFGVIWPSRVCENKWCAPPISYSPIQRFFPPYQGSFYPFQDDFHTSSMLCSKWTFYAVLWPRFDRVKTVNWTVQISSMCFLKEWVSALITVLFVTLLQDTFDCVVQIRLVVFLQAIAYLTKSTIMELLQVLILNVTAI